MEEYAEPNQTSVVKIVNGWKQLAVYAISSILHVWQVYEYASL